jgi:hypothetical protein
MELEEMKTLWEEMSIEIEKQKKLTDTLIIKMTQADYRNKLNKILIPEAIATFICFAAIGYILFNFQQLNTWYLVLCGIISVIILFLLSVLSIKAIYKMRSSNILSNNYKQALQEYSKGKIQFVYAQKLGFYLGALLMVVILPVMGRVMDGKDVFKIIDVWYWYVIAFPLFYGFARWVFKRYIKIAGDAENILKELEN